jgi:Fe2+ or Zn2+ uptake regulation protein
VGLGLALCEVYYTRNPWVTAQYLAQRHGHISVDTVRRRLEELTEAGLVEFIEPDSRRLYKATTEAADRTIKLVEEALVLPGEQDNDGFVKIARMGEAR